MACPAFLVFMLVQDGPFDRGEVRLLCSADLHCRLFGWPKRAYAFFPEYIQEKSHPPFLDNCIIVYVFLLFMCFKVESNLSLENCFLQSVLLSSPLQFLTTIYVWTIVIIYNPAGL